MAKNEKTPIGTIQVKKTKAMNPNTSSWLPNSDSFVTRCRKERNDQRRTTTKDQPRISHFRRRYIRVKGQVEAKDSRTIKLASDRRHILRIRRVIRTILIKQFHSLCSYIHFHLHFHSFFSSPLCPDPCPLGLEDFIFAIKTSHSSSTFLWTVLTSLSFKWLNRP